MVDSPFWWIAPARTGAEGQPLIGGGWRETVRTLGAAVLIVWPQMTTQADAVAMVRKLPRNHSGMVARSQQGETRE